MAGPGARKQERAVSEGFHASGKERFALLVASDFDPEGFELADDAVRSLRDLWRVPVDYFRIAVTRDFCVLLLMVAS